MYDRILVPTDGHSAVSQVAEHAFELAALTGATVHAVYVLDVSGVPDPDQESLAASLRADGEAALERIADRGRDRGVEVVTSVRRGTAHEEIVACAAEADVDLVVMGTHGRTGLNRFLLGSVTDRVIRSGDVPVLVLNLEHAGGAVSDAEAARAVAREELAREGHEVSEFPEEPYRESGTWIVRARTGDGTTYNVHVNAESGDARAAKIE